MQKLFSHIASVLQSTRSTTLYDLDNKAGHINDWKENDKIPFNDEHQCACEW